MKEEEKTHQVKVDVFTEFQDIATWLPRIAAATDGMDEGKFKTVSGVSTELSKLTRTLTQDKSDETNCRQNFRNNQHLKTLIDQLKSLAKDAKDSTKEASS